MMTRLYAWIILFAVLLTSGASANDFYNHSGVPATGSPGSSAQMRAEFASIAAGFDKLPAFTGNANKAVIINSGATGMTVTTGALSLAGNFTISGAFATTLTVTGATTLTLPTTGTLATLAGTEALTNKTVNLTSNTLTGTIAQFNTALSDGDFATLAGAETLTNKTLTTPVIASISNGGTVTIPSGVDTLVGRASTDTLTNKTLAGGLVTADPTVALGIASKQYVDANISTGDVKLTLKTTADTGWVLMNDGSIGSAASGATTRANADTESLYTLIWNNVADQWAPVTGGRGASAAADFSANKPIALPKTLGRSLAGYGTGSTVETVTSQAATSNAIPVQSNNTKWVTGMFVTLSNVSGFAGLSNGTYYVVRASSTTVKFASSLANAQNGTVLTVTGTGSFTMTYTFTTRALGEQAGEEAHAMSITELLSHNHTTDFATVGGGPYPTGGNTPIQTGTSFTGGNAAMNIMQPTAFLNVMIKL